MASRLNDNFVSAQEYNSLPTIGEVGEAPDHHSQELEKLRSLLVKHDVPKGVSIRLIHKHSDTQDGEIMVFSKVPVPDYKSAIIMKPVLLESEAPKGLHGIHFFVDANAVLRAYEYSDSVVPDMADHQAFLAEFCNMIIEHGLQRIFGLKLQDSTDEAHQTNYTEFELPDQRGTIMFPEGMPMPDGNSDLSVTTEWKTPTPRTPLPGRLDCISHCKHCNGHVYIPDGCENLGDGHDDHIRLGGHCLLPGTAVHGIVQQIVAAF